MSEFDAREAKGAGTMSGTMSGARPGARILVVEDERHLAEGICENLIAEGYRAETTAEGEVALQRLLTEDFDLVLLDVMLLGMDGFTVCEKARQAGRQTPILFLTAKGSVDDRIRGLQSGGDDYLTKPFHLRELLARVQTILRRWDWYGNESLGESILRFGGNEVDLHQFRGVSWDGSSHELTQKEAMVVKALAEASGQVVSRDDLLEKVWGYEVYPSTRAIDALLGRLRRKFERDPDAPRHFLTVRGVGYRFDPEGDGA